MGTTVVGSGSGVERGRREGEMLSLSLFEEGRVVCHLFLVSVVR